MEGINFNGSRPWEDKTKKEWEVGVKEWFEPMRSDFRELRRYSKLMELFAKHEQRYLKKGLGHPPDDCEDATEWHSRTGRDPAKRLYHYTVMWHPKKERLQAFAPPSDLSRTTDFPIIPPQDKVEGFNEDIYLVWSL